MWPDEGVWWSGGLFKRYLRWTEDPATEKRTLLEHYYEAVEMKYRDQPVKTPEDHHRDAKACFAWLGQRLQGISCIISGAASISWQTQDFTRARSNTDLAINADKKVLEALVDAFEPEGAYLVERSLSWKFRRKSEDKYHVYRPIPPLRIMKDLHANMNLMFVKADRTERGRNYFLAESTARNPVRIYLHQQSGKSIVSIEEKKAYQFTVPEEYLNPIKIETSMGGTIQLMPLQYMYAKLKAMHRAEEGLLHEKHLHDINLIKAVITQNQGF
ncbi:hypothetical protein HYZ97_00400 [Candidatus Pacearchaeota archaeon]|nr:hypothetical protein [Candidatus Pacearchaeota archaeon]